jgi:precorrin-3B synthase
MSSGDGWLTRIKPPKAVLTSAAARVLAATAAEFGNGMIELTGRANLQVRGLAPDRMVAFAKAIVASGLADADPATERRRAVIHSPLAHANLCVAPEIEAILARAPELASLPVKFCVAVDAGGPLPLGPTVADVTVICTEASVMILPAGSHLGANVPATEAAAAVRRVAQSFLALARECTPSPRRMRTLIAMIGAPRLFAAAGLAPGVPATPPPVQRVIGWLSFPDSDKGSVGLGVPFGAMIAATLTSLADLAERYGNGEIQLTPWRAVLLPNIAGGDRDAIQAAGARLDLIVDPTDSRRAIVTCTGQPRCAAASVNVRADAALLPHLHLPTPIHVSGCAKGCARHASAPITLVGEDGRYGIVRNGNARGVPSLRGLTMQQVVDALGDGK